MIPLLINNHHRDTILQAVSSDDAWHQSGGGQRPRVRAAPRRGRGLPLRGRQSRHRREHRVAAATPGMTVGGE